MGIDPFVHPDVVGDNTAMPFADRSLDIVVYDPPHTGEQGKSKFARVYGTGVAVAKTGGLAHTYLTVLYIDKRGLNLRNDLAHGLLPPSVFNRQIADRVFHSLLALSLIRVKSQKQGGS